ncbi:O-antigen ligase family protein [Cytobacillus gottheilii]|uniref:O-antigen ligase family protein n=1 Tax=Cytobacillus gottheilii TaxID=859144 RepID=UPI0009BA3760|nr:O-antigen ligase family protein [Cytobacillus gottheilii]
MLKITRENIILLSSVILVIVGLVFNHSMLAAIICLLLAIGTLSNKSLGIMFLLMYIPVRPFLITVNPGFKVIGDAIVFALLVRTVFDYRKNVKQLFVFNKFEIAFLLFCVIGSISALLTDVSLTAIIFQLRAYLLFYILFYVLKRMDYSEFNIKKYALLTFLLAVVLSLQGFVEKISDKTLLMPEEWTNWWLSPTNHVRVYGLLKGPNELSLYLMIAIFISIYLISLVSVKNRKYIYIGISLIFTTILLTYSRGALLCAIGFGIIYLVLYRETLKKIIVPAIIIGAASTMLFFSINWGADIYYSNVIENEQNYADEETGDTESESSNKGSNRYKDAFSKTTLEQSMSAGRIYYVQKGVEIFKDYPIIGSGFATFGGAATLSYSSPIYEDYNIDRDFYSDNQYILVLVETGIVGTLALFATFIFLALFVWKRKTGYYFSPLLMFLFISTLIGGSVYNILENDSFMMFFYMILGLAAHFAKNNEISSKL